jgi:hypothetical protein
MKMNSHTTQQQEKQYEQYIGYEEWLRENSIALNGDDLSKMEKLSANNKDYKKEI